MKSSSWGILLLIGLIFLAGGSLMVPTNVRRLAWAIANAERGPDEIASGVIVRNNPGDIEANGVLNHYSTLQQGWDALYHMIEGWFNNTSAIYHPSMTISEIATWYVNGSANPTPDSDGWASNVSSYLGVSTDTQLNQL